MRLSSIFRRHLQVLAAAALTAGAVHAEMDDELRKAVAMTESGQAEQAYKLLEPSEARRAGDSDFDLAFGIAANAAGEFTRAIMAFERILATDPGHARARVELGRALYGVGDNKSARALLSDGQRAGVASVAGETIDQILHAIDRIDAAGQSSYRSYVEFGITDDSNINGAPGITSVAVPAYGGSILAIDPAGSRQSGGSIHVGAGLSGRYVLDPRWSLIGNASLTARHYAGSLSKYDLLQFDVNGGLSYRVERDEYTLVAQAGTYDTDGQRTRNLSGLVGEWTYRFDGFRQFNAYAQFTRLSYPSQHVADADRRVVGFSYAHLFTSGFWTYGGAYMGRESVRSPGVDYLGHRLVGLRLGAQWPLRAGLALFVSGGYESRRFGGSDPNFNVGREDDQSNLALGLSWVPAQQWRVTPQFSLTSTRSNIPLSEFDKRSVSLTARRDF